MADQGNVPISLETQNKVAKAIYLRWHRNGARHPRSWNEMATEDKEPCERRGQGATVKIWSQCSAVCIAPEDDEERQACEIAVNALLRWSAEHDKEKEQQ